MEASEDGHRFVRLWTVIRNRWPWGERIEYSWIVMALCEDDAETCCSRTFLRSLDGGDILDEIHPGAKSRAQ